MEAVVLQRVGFLEYFCPKQGQDFKPSAAPIYPDIDKVPPGRERNHRSNVSSARNMYIYFSHG